MIDKQVFIDKARFLQKPIPNDTDIEAALAKYQETTIIKSWRKRIEVKIWDKKSNINNATADYILETNAWADEIYLLLVDGKIVFLQSHEPFVVGVVPMSIEVVENIAANHANNLAIDFARNEILESVLADLNLVN